MVQDPIFKVENITSNQYKRKCSRGNNDAARNVHSYGFQEECETYTYTRSPLIKANQKWNTEKKCHHVQFWGKWTNSIQVRVGIARQTIQFTTTEEKRPHDVTNTNALKRVENKNINMSYNGWELHVKSFNSLSSMPWKKGHGGKKYVKMFPKLPTWKMLKWNM